MQKRVVFNDEIYTVIYDYGNGRIEIRKEKSSYPYVELVKKEQVRLVTKDI
ncbi:hypothetical protein [Niallia oryzisoli]|uniref:hypothetical protein n=1 Tax=Niallia oryzisoli TaxID=1737571 RepID=UPI0037369EEE